MIVPIVRFLSLIFGSIFIGIHSGLQVGLASFFFGWVFILSFVIEINKNKNIKSENISKEFIH